MVENYLVGVEPDKEKLYQLEGIRRGDHQSTVENRHIGMEPNKEKVHLLEVIRES